MTSTFKPDPTQAARLAAMLRDSAPIHARIGDTAFAETLAYAAAGLDMIAACASFPVLRASPEPPTLTSAPRLARHRQAEIAQTWFLNRQEQFEGSAPPSESRDIEDARIAIPGVSRSMIRKYRPIEWRVGRGRKPNSP